MIYYELLPHDFTGFSRRRLGIILHRQQKKQQIGK